MFQPDRLYSANELSEILDIPYSTLAKWRLITTGPAFKKLGGHVRYLGRDLNSWLDKQTVKPSAA